MIIFGCMNFFVWIMLEVTTIFVGHKSLLKVRILNWNYNVLGYAKITNIFGVCLKGLILF